MKNVNHSVFQTTILTIAAITLCANIAFAQDKGFVVKLLYYAQTNASRSVLGAAMFMGSLQCYGASTVTNVTLTPPSKSPISLDLDVNEFRFRDEYMSQTALDIDFPNGNYVFSIKSLKYDSSVPVSLTGNTYPAAPLISNFTAAQAINPNQDFTLTWNNLGLTSNDFLLIEITDSTHDNTIFETPGPLMPGALPGNLTSFTIPANTLCPGAQYDAHLIAVKIVNVVTNDNRDGTKTILTSGYGVYLDFPIKTTGSPISLVSWDKPNFVFFFPDGKIYGTNASYTGTIVTNYNMYFQVSDPSPTNTVYFTGPAGSGLNNTPSSWFNNMGAESGYSSPFISLSSPNQITGGVYTIKYKSVNLKFTFSNPQISSRQILLLPEFVVGNDGILKQLKWSYIAPDGSKVPPQSFMERVGISIHSSYGDLFIDWNIRPAFTNYDVTAYNIRWSDVDSVQIRFIDSYYVDGNNYVTIYRVLSGPQPLSIITDSLSGTRGQSFSQMLTASGGTYPYTWSIEYGFLPGGLVLDNFSGLISGTPAETGSFKVNVKVTDAMNQTATKDIFIQIAPGTFTHRPAFTNMTVLNGRPMVTFLTMPGQFYMLEMSEDLKNWKVTDFFTAPPYSITQSVPDDILRSYSKLFFRMRLGHKFYSDLLMTFFANAGSINPNAPYNVTVNYPVSISSTRVKFCAGFDPDYASPDMVYFSSPMSMNTQGIEPRFDNDDPGTIGYYVERGIVPPAGGYVVNYKGTNITFNINHQGNTNLVVPVPSFTVNNGQLTAISWNFVNRTTGTIYRSLPSFIRRLQIQIDDFNNSRIYDSDDIYNLSVSGSLTLNSQINWNNVRTVNMTYYDTNDVYYVISFSK